MISAIIDALTPVADAFDQLGIPYCVGGSVASSHYGRERATNDIDLVADVRSQHIQPLTEQLQGQYYIDSYMIRDALLHKTSFNVVHRGTGIKIDVFVLQDTPFMHSQMQHIRQVQFAPEGRLFSVASPEDTLLAKLNWYKMGGGVSSRQWADILDLISYQWETLDLDYVYETAPQLGVADLLEKALAEADATPQS